MQLLKVKLAGIGLEDIKMPDLKSLWKLPDISSADVNAFLKSMNQLKNGLMKVDFGALGSIDVDIKGGGTGAAVERLDKILAFMESKNGIIWA